MRRTGTGAAETRTARAEGEVAGEVAGGKGEGVEEVEVFKVRRY